MEAAATGSLSVSTTPEVPAFGSSSSGQFLWMASLQAPHFKPENRAPLDLIVVLDRSGSMSGSKLDLCKQTMKFVIDQLDSTDRLGLVVYDDWVQTVFDLMPMNADNKQRAHDLSQQVQVGGCTNLYGGLEQAVRMMNSRTEKNEVASVLLLTDGHANVGPSTLPSILASLARMDGSPEIREQMPQVQVQQMHQVQQMPPMQQAPPQMNFPVQQMPMQQMPMQQMPVQQMSTPMNFVIPPTSTLTPDELPELDLKCTLYTFGYGSDHDPNLLKGLAEAGSGVYYFIQSTKDVPEAFADCLGGLLSVVAQNITMKIEVQKPVTIKKLWTKFKQTEITPGQCYELALGDIQSEERRDIVISVDMPALDQEVQVYPFANVTVTYFNVLSSKMESKSTTAAISRPAKPPLNQQKNYELDKHQNRLLAAEAMKEATDAGNAGDLEKARKILQSAISRIKESVSREDPFCKGLVQDLERCGQALKDQHTFTNMGNQMLQTNYNAHFQQRSTSVQMAAQASYQTSTRGMMQAKQQMYFH